jgi:hypothetical protein
VGRRGMRNEGRGSPMFRRVLLPFLPIVLSEGGGDRQSSTFPGPLPPPLAGSERKRESENELGPTPLGSCTPGKTSIAGLRRLPPRESYDTLCPYWEGGGGNHAVRDELQKPRLLISRLIVWGFSQILFNCNPRLCSSPLAVHAQLCLLHIPLMTIVLIAFPRIFSRVPWQAVAMGIVSLSFLDMCWTSYRVVSRGGGG